MFARTMARTGIDIGTAFIKLVRSEGKRSLERLTHFDSEPWDGSDRQKRVAHAAEALSNLLQRNGLRRRKLGRIVASCGWQEHAVREVSLPRLSQEELNLLSILREENITTDELKEALTHIRIRRKRPNFKELYNAIAHMNQFSRVENHIDTEKPEESK